MRPASTTEAVSGDRLTNGWPISQLIELYPRSNRASAVAQRVVNPRKKSRVDHAEVVGEAQGFRLKADLGGQYCESVENRLPKKQPVVGELITQGDIRCQRRQHE